MSTLLGALLAGAAGWFWFELLDARRALRVDGPIDETPSRRAAARNGHLAALCATAAGFTFAEAWSRWPFALGAVVVTRVLVELIARRVVPPRG